MAVEHAVLNPCRLRGVYKVILLCLWRWNWSGKHPWVSGPAYIDKSLKLRDRVSVRGLTLRDNGRLEWIIHRNLYQTWNWISCYFPTFCFIPGAFVETKLTLKIVLPQCSLFCNLFMFMNLFCSTDYKLYLICIWCHLEIRLKETLIWLNIC